MGAGNWAGSTGLLILWRVVGRWWKLAFGHVDIVWVAWVVIGNSSCFFGLGPNYRSRRDIRATDWSMGLRYGGGGDCIYLMVPSIMEDLG